MRVAAFVPARRLLIGERPGVAWVAFVQKDGSVKGVGVWGTLRSGTFRLRAVLETEVCGGACASLVCRHFVLCTLRPHLLARSPALALLAASPPPATMSLRR